MQPHILLISLVPGVGGLWSVSYLHGVVIVSATKWKFVAALLMALPRPLSTHPPQAPTTRPPFGPTMCAAVVSVLMCQVFYLRVLPTLILFGPLARETALEKINFNIRKSRFESLSLRGVI